jgi:hypothetical protein
LQASTSGNWMRKFGAEANLISNWTQQNCYCKIKLKDDLCRRSCKLQGFISFKALISSSFILRARNQFLENLSLKNIFIRNCFHFKICVKIFNFSKEFFSWDNFHARFDEWINFSCFQLFHLLLIAASCKML